MRSALNHGRSPAAARLAVSRGQGRPSDSIYERAGTRTICDPARRLGFVENTVPSGWFSSIPAKHKPFLLGWLRSLRACGSSVQHYASRHYQ